MLASQEAPDSPPPLVRHPLPEQLRRSTPGQCVHCFHETSQILVNSGITIDRCCTCRATRIVAKA